MQETFEPGAALELIARERVTEPYTLPHQTAALVEHPDWETADLSSLRSVFGKSAFAAPPHACTATRRGRCRSATGSPRPTRSSPVTRANAGREVMKASIGRLMPGNELRIVDPDTGRILGPNEDGEFVDPRADA